MQGIPITQARTSENCYCLGVASLVYKRVYCKWQRFNNSFLTCYWLLQTSIFFVRAVFLGVYSRNTRSDASQSGLVLSTDYQLRSLGMISTYSGGGYVIILEPGRYNRKRLWELEQNLWIDHNTRAVLTEFTTYNGQSNLFTIVTLVAEFPASGGVVTFNSLQTVRLYDFTESSMVFVRCIQAVFLSFIAYFLFKSAKNLYQQGWDFFYQFWNVIEAALVLFAAAATGLYVYRYKSVSNLLERVNSHPFKFKSFQFASYWDDLYTFVMAAIVCLATLKFNRLLRYK